MTTNDREGAALFTRAVQETLDTVVAPLVRDALIHDALALGGLERLPTSRIAMREFATGPLRTVTERALGTELAHSVADEILRVVPPSSSRRAHPQSRGSGRPSAPAVRRSTPPPVRRSTPPPHTRRTLVGPGTHPARQSPAPGRLEPVPAPISTRAERAVITTPPPGMIDARAWSVVPESHSRARADTEPAPSRTPLVLVATEDPALLQTLTEWFSNRAYLSPVRDPIELVRKLDAGGDRRAIVILDGKVPSIRPGALAALLEALPHVEVVLCRAAAATEEIALSASASTARWTVYREPASLDHVAAECVRLVS